MDMSFENGELLNIIVLITISKDVRSLLPREMIEHFENQGVKFTQY
jgi:hypothetical protein